MLYDVLTSPATAFGALALLGLTVTQMIAIDVTAKGWKHRMVVLTIIGIACGVVGLTFTLHQLIALFYEVCYDT